MTYLAKKDALLHLKNFLENTHSRDPKKVDESIAMTAVVPLLRFVGQKSWADDLEGADQSALRSTALKWATELSSAINSYQEKLDGFKNTIGEMTIYEFEEYLSFIGR